VADRTGIAIAFIKHLNKSDSGNVGNLVSGSRAYVNFPRMGLILGPDPGAPENEDRRVLAFHKHNVIRGRKGLSLRLVQLDAAGQDAVLALPQMSHLNDEQRGRMRRQLFRVEFLGDSDVTGDDLARARARAGKDDSGGKQGRAERAAPWLEEFLMGGPKDSEEVVRASREAGHSRNALYAAKGLLGVKAVRIGFGASGRWAWSLAAQAGAASTSEDGPATVRDHPGRFDYWDGPGKEARPDEPGKEAQPKESRQPYASKPGTLWDSMGRCGGRDPARTGDLTDSEGGAGGAEPSPANPKSPEGSQRVPDGSGRDGRDSMARDPTSADPPARAEKPAPTPEPAAAEQTPLPDGAALPPGAEVF
jgi:hypothetical protein